MGWWLCDESGGINWNRSPSGGKESNLVNAIPGRDTKEDYYNGDQPADAMYEPIDFLTTQFTNKSKKPTAQQLIDLFVNNKKDQVFQHIDKKTLERVIRKTWKTINDIYLNSWHRPMYPEEKNFVCKFSFNRADDPEFWEGR